MGQGGTAEQLASAILAMSGKRGPDSSICPSEAARAVGGDEWRDLMEPTREVARDLARRGQVRITAQGKTLNPDEPWQGPIRIHTTGD